MFKDLPVPVFKENCLVLKKTKPQFLSTDSSEATASDVGFPPSSLPQLFSQGELNDLTRDRNLSKESSELLASRLKEKIYFSLELS